MKIAIVGIGKMGSWLMESMRDRYEIGIFDIDKKKIRGIKGVTTLSELSDIEEFDPDILVNAVNLRDTTKTFDRVIPYLSKECILADIASIKGDLPNYYLKTGHKFVSTHPMFGPTNANMNLPLGENAIIIRESDPTGRKVFRDLYLRKGLKLYEFTFAEHDLMMAYSLTLPFSASMVFAACVDLQTVPGTNFRKHLDLARGILSEDDNLLSEILFNPKSISQIEKITSRLEFLKHVIRDRDYEEAGKFFAKLREKLGR